MRRAYRVTRPQLNEAFFCLHPYLIAPAVSNGLFSGGSQESRDPRRLGPRAQGVEAAGDGGRGNADRHGDDQERHRQLDEREAALHLTDQDVTSAFSPSPPGAPSAPRLQMSKSP